MFKPGKQTCLVQVNNHNFSLTLTSVIQKSISKANVHSPKQHPKVVVTIMSNQQPNSNSWQNLFFAAIHWAVAAYVDLWMNIFIAMWMSPEDWTTIHELDVDSVYPTITPVM